MAEAKEWRFEQLAGADRKIYTLRGYSAPHGRPRRGAVVTDELTVRQQESHYGGKGPPSRLVFGTKQEPWRLRGRFMDRELGRGGAAIEARNWKAFVNDTRPVAVMWGDLLAFRGLITKIILGYESDAEITWELHVAIDQDQWLPKQAARQRRQTPRQMVDDLEEFLQSWLIDLPTAPKGPNLFGQLAAFKEDLLDSLDNIVSAVNTPVAALSKAVEEVDAFSSASASSLGRLRAGANQATTAVLELDEMLGGTDPSAVLFMRTADTDIAWQSYKSEADVTATDILALLADFDRQAEIAQRGSAANSITALADDTWEAIATRAGGGPEDGDRIRDANGVRFGERPVSGRTYVIPSL